MSRRLGVMAAAVLLGCAGGCRTTDDAARVVVDVRRSGGAAERYEVDHVGAIRWGGGFDAMDGATTWEGRLTGEEAARLEALLDALAADPPVSDGSFGGLPRWRIVRRDPGAALDVRLADLAGHPDAAALVALLDRAARRRLERRLDALPQAGERR